MDRSFTFGVVGGYGATGRVVVSELCKSGAGTILIGGRDVNKAGALAQQFNGRAAAADVDVLNQNSLDNFCDRCSLIVNTAGPVMVLKDRVAQAALRKGCHYVDAAGLLTVKESMLAQTHEIADFGLSFVISAGLLPGISEVLPLYAESKARSAMDIGSLTVYYGDTGEWSQNAFREIAWLLRQRHPHLRSGYFHKGKWVSVNFFKAARRLDLGHRLGSRLFYMGFVPEMSEIGPRRIECDLFSYACLPGLRTAAIGTLATALPLPQRLIVGLLRNAFRKDRLPIGGFIVVKVIGHTEQREQTYTVEFLYGENEGYAMNGLVAATVARMIAEHKSVPAGLHFLPDAVNPVVFLAELRRAGIEPTESLASSPSATYL